MIQDGRTQIIRNVGRKSCSSDRSTSALKQTQRATRYLNGVIYSGISYNALQLLSFVVEYSYYSVSKPSHTISGGWRKNSNRCGLFSLLNILMITICSNGRNIKRIHLSDKRLRRRSLFSCGRWLMSVTGYVANVSF